MDLEEAILKKLIEKCESPEYFEKFIKNFIFTTYQSPRFICKHRGYDFITGKPTQEKFDVIIEDVEKTEKCFVSITAIAQENLRAYIDDEIKKFNGITYTRKEMRFYTKYPSTNTKVKKTISEFEQTYSFFHGFYLNDVANECINHPEYKHLIYELLPDVYLLDNVFSQVDERFQFLINRNFLHKFDNSENTDYLQLLSMDFRRIFFSFFKRNNCLCIVGKRGVGKTFASLLLGRILQREGYKVFYSSLPEIQPEKIRQISKSIAINNRFVFFIDDCQGDIENTLSILEQISSVKNPIERPKLIFLIRNDDLERKEIMENFDDIKERFRQEVPILEFKEKYIDLKFLSKLFFDRIGFPQRFDLFASLLDQNDLSKTLFNYKNMEFWNIFFRSLKRRIEKDPEITMKEDDFFMSAYNFFSHEEPYLIECKDVLVHFLPFFKNDLPVVRSFMEDIIQTHPEQFQRLLENGVLISRARMWGRDSAEFIVGNIHCTKAEILEMLFIKYSKLAKDEATTLIDYISKYPWNLYYIITPISFHNVKTLEKMCNDEVFSSVVKKYFRIKRLTKYLDRVIKTFSKLDQQSKNALVDDETIDALAKKCNNSEYYLISKLYLFRAMYKLSPLLAYKLYEKFDSAIFISSFNNNPYETGIYTFSKFMEVFKNIYYFADPSEKKERILDTVKEILDSCFQEFVRRFETWGIFFSQFHWLLKRLDGMKLGNYFLEKIPPAKVVEWIRSKDTNIVELSRYLLKDAKYTTFAENDGTRRKYFDYFKNSLEYVDIKKIFDNKRSGLYDVAINSNYEFLANYLYRYSSEDAFVQKVLNETAYLTNTSIDLVNKNIYLSDKEKNFIVSKIKVGIGLKEKRPLTFRKK